MRRCYEAATLDIYVPSGDDAKSNSLAAATNELDRLFSKDDFGEMEVLGIILYFRLQPLFVKVPFETILSRYAVDFMDPIKNFNCYAAYLVWTI